MTATPPRPSSVSETASCRPSVAVWSWPIALGALTIFGLFSALLGQHGVWLALSWIALSLPPIVTVICLCRAWSHTPYKKGGQS